MFHTSIIVDHIRPLCLGGKNNLNNYQGICHMCDKTKTGVIDHKLTKMYNNNELKSNQLTNNLIINMHKKYFKERGYEDFI